jgi:osmotically-inducible protein OsmY
MFRLLFRLIVLLCAVAIVGVVLLGWWPGGGFIRDSPLGGRVDRDTVADEVRAAGEKAGAKAAEVAGQAQEALATGGVTAKIKAKMALDELVQARDIKVDFADGVVTLTGTVRSDAERARAVDLARETAGVSRVVDHLARAERQ